MPDEKVR